MYKEFKEFIARGNVIDLAVAVVVGAAFNQIVTALVDHMIMPLVGILLGGLDFSTLTIVVGDAVIAYGLFIQSIVDFLIIAFAIFMFVKFINSLRRKEEEVIEEEIDASEQYLKEIRDLLQEMKK